MPQEVGDHLSREFFFEIKGPVEKHCRETGSLAMPIRVVIINKRASESSPPFGAENVSEMFIDLNGEKRS